MDGVSFQKLEAVVTHTVVVYLICPPVMKLLFQRLITSTVTSDMSFLVVTRAQIDFGKYRRPLLIRQLIWVL